MGKGELTLKNVEFFFMLMTPETISRLKDTLVVDNHPTNEVCHIKFFRDIIDRKLK